MSEQLKGIQAVVLYVDEADMHTGLQSAIDFKSGHPDIPVSIDMRGVQVPVQVGEEADELFQRYGAAFAPAYLHGAGSEVHLKQFEPQVDRGSKGV